MLNINNLLELFAGLCPLEGAIFIVSVNDLNLMKKIAPNLFNGNRLTPIYFDYFCGKIIKEICNKYYGQSPNISDDSKPNIMNAEIMQTVLNTHKLDMGYDLFMQKYSNKLNL
jgi:hypothetical protein